jgi:hypothetical protein
MYRSLSVVFFTFGLLLFGFCETGNAQILCGKLRGMFRGSNCCPQSCNPCPTQVCPSCVDPCCQRIQIMRLPTTKREECERCCLGLYPNGQPWSSYQACVDACCSGGTSSARYCVCTQKPDGTWSCCHADPAVNLRCPPTRRFRLFGR